MIVLFDETISFQWQALIRFIDNWQGPTRHHPVHYCMRV